MSYPTIFANLAGGNQPLALFDTMFAQVAQMIAIPTTASGVNAITLTPITNAPALTAYTQFCAFNFKAAATSTGLVTAGQTGLALLPVYRADGTTQITANDLISGQPYTILFASQLNSGGGGFYLLRSTISPVVQAAGGSFSGLTIAPNVGAPDTKVDVAATEIVMVNPSNGSAFNQQAPAFTIDTGTVGANGIDGGSLAASNWYYVFAISNGSVTSGLISLSSTNPTMPGGYSFLKRLGALRTDITDGHNSTVTISNASPAVVTWNANGLNNLEPVVFSTTGSLPTPLVPGTTYYTSNVLANTFSVSATPGGAQINTSSAGSGTHTATVPNVRFVRTQQRGRDAQYVIQAAPVPPFLPPLVASGTAGTYSATNPALVTVSISTIVPPTAANIKLMASNTWANNPGAGVLVAPNANWGGTGNGPNGTGEFNWPIALPPTVVSIGCIDLTLESSNIAWCSSATGGAVSCLGWRDNV